MGPLHGVRVIELPAIGPVPFAGTLLSDLGADVIRIDRVGLVDRADHPEGFWIDGRGRRSIAVDLKQPAGREVALRLVDGADALLEGFRPGVAERLGLGPEVCSERNPRLVYGRMTGWGQEGPLSQTAGHDIDYISVAGALAHLGREGAPPTPPINLLGDYGGGAMFLALGVIAALFEARASGTGQVVDAAMVDGVAYLMLPMWGLKALDMMSDERGTNLLDSGAPFYDTYETADGEWIAIGTVEHAFFFELLDRIGVARERFPDHNDRTCWDEMRATFRDTFRTRTRAEWSSILEGTDACYAPVLRMTEAVDHPHMRARNTFIEAAGLTQPAPAPRFSRTGAEIQGLPPVPGGDTDDLLATLGYSAEEIAELEQAGAAAQRRAPVTE